VKAMISRKVWPRFIRNACRTSTEADQPALAGVI
jgi:hypothetical protein